MDSKYKMILQQHRPFLARNIIWSPQLAELMKTNDLLTDFMISDINACEKREARVHKLIDVIPLRGSHNFNKFIEVLMLSGHVFIADFLHEDEEHQKLFDIKDMYKNLPFVQRAFNETEKKEIEAYMAERIESQILKLLWKRDNREKDKALEAKLKQIEQSHDFEAQYQAKADTITKLETEISASLEDKQELKAKLATLANAHREMEMKNKETLSVQMRYNAANDNAIERAKEKISELESVLRQIHSRVQEMLIAKTANPHMKDNKANGHSAIGRRDSGALAERISIEMAKKQFSYVLSDLESLINEYNELLDVKSKYEKLLEERDYILIHFGVEPERKQKNSGGKKNNNIKDNKNNSAAVHDQELSLVTAYKDFAVRNDENITKMKKEIEKYGGLLEENKAKLEGLTKEKDDSSKRMAVGLSSWQSAIMNVMRKQLQDTKVDLRKKETMMTMQEEELTKLKLRIIELEQQQNQQQSAVNSDLLSVHPRDHDGRLSAVSMDSVELIPSETPKPTKARNLPPLKSSKHPAKPSQTAASTSPRGTIMRSSKANNSQFVTSIRVQGEPTHNYITFPIGPISAQIKPETRGRPMGSVLGDLKAMNKHFNKPTMEDSRVSKKSQSNSSFIK